MKLIRLFLFFIGLVVYLLTSCVTKKTRLETIDQHIEISEFEAKVKIEDYPSISSNSKDEKPLKGPEKKNSKSHLSLQGNSQKMKKNKMSGSFSKSQNSNKDLSKNSQDIGLKEELHEPDIEGQEGFIGRRPKTDPFVPGERILYEVSYIGMGAGYLSLEVKPWVQVNGRKHYHFEGKIWTKPFFSKIYMVEDRIESMLDFETMLPTIYKLQVKETNQIKEARFFINTENHTAFYWEKKMTEKGEEEVKKEWETLPYSQDVFSSIFYLRVFPWQLGMKRSFRVTDDGKNLTYHGEIIKEEFLTLECGEFNTLVLKPQIELQGKIKMTGDFLIWLTNDHYKSIVKIKAKLSFGSLIAQAIQIHRP